MIWLKEVNKYMDYTVFVKDDYIDNGFIVKNGKESLAVFYLLSRNMTLRSRIDNHKIKWHEIIFNLKTLYKDLHIPLNRKHQKDIIINTISNLINANVFNGDIDIKANIDEIIRLECQIIKENFTLITDKEFNAIFEYRESRIDNYGLFNTYIALKKCSNTETKICFPSIDYLKFTCNVSSNGTMSRYINILEELNLIKCKRGQKYIDATGETKKSNNIYTILN